MIEDQLATASVAPSVSIPGKNRRRPLVFRAVPAIGLLGAGALNELRQLYRFRDMFMGLVSRDVRQRYKGSFFGILWSMMNPLLMMIIYTVVFSVIMKVTVPRYPLFIFCGLLSWMWFQTSLTNGCTTIVSNGSLIKKVAFPTEILPLVAVTSNLVNLLLSLPVLALFMIVFGVPPTAPLLLFPVLLGIQYILTAGLAFLLSATHVFFRDTEQVLANILMFWMYVTPVIYSADMIPKRYMRLLLLNPMAPLVMSYQHVILYGQWPPVTYLAYPLTVGLVLCAAGFGVFSKLKYRFAEEV